MVALLQADRRELAAAHESGHATMAIHLGWQIGNISLAHCEIRPRGALDPLQLALIDVAGDAGVIAKFGRPYLTRAALFHRLYIFDIDLLVGIDAIRSGDIEKLDDGHFQQDADDALARLIEVDPDAEPELIIRAYRRLERTALGILKARAREHNEICRQLLRHEAITRKERRWWDY